jgi:hypothetical protein
MKIYTVAEKFIVLRGDKTAGPKYRRELSKLIIQKFGREPYSAETVTEILGFIQSYYIEKFHQI